jgi:hypothetical protein
MDIIDASLIPVRDANIILSGMWAIWKARNDRLHGNKDGNLMKTMLWAINTTHDLWNVGAKTDGLFIRRRARNGSLLMQES